MKSEIVKSNEDIFTMGSLVETNSGGLIILCTGLSSEAAFAGIVIHEHKSPNVGEYSDKWIKECYKKFTGEIKLTQ